MDSEAHGDKTSPDADVRVVTLSSDDSSDSSRTLKVAHRKADWRLLALYMVIIVALKCEAMAVINGMFCAHNSTLRFGER